MKRSDLAVVEQFIAAEIENRGATGLSAYIKEATKAMAALGRVRKAIPLARINIVADDDQVSVKVGKTALGPFAFGLTGADLEKVLEAAAYPSYGYRYKP